MYRSTAQLRATGVNARNAAQHRAVGVASDFTAAELKAGGYSVTQVVDEEICGAEDTAHDHSRLVTYIRA